MLLTRYPLTVSKPSGVKLEPTPPITPDSSYIADGLTTGALASWANKELTASFAVTGTPQVALDGTEKVVVLNGTTDRLSAAAGPAWKTVAMIVKLPAATTGEDYLVGPATASNGQVVYNSATGLVYWRNGTAAQVTAPAAAGWNVITATIGAAGAATLSVNKMHAGGTIGTAMPPAGLRAGGHFSSGQHAAVSFKQIRQWIALLPTAEIENFVDYAKAKYPTLNIP